MEQILECIPNFSEGKSPEVVAAIVAAIKEVPDVYVLHTDMGYDAHRTVITFAGVPEAVVEAAFRAIQEAARLIDMRQQKGAHPRIGATDVCPLVPVKGIDMAQTVKLAKALAERVGRELGIPVYCYEEAASSPERRNLAWLRKGDYEALPQRMKQADFVPDYGPRAFNARAGASVIGARNFLIAWNINLSTPDAHIAKQIAAILRESGGKWQTENGTMVHQQGRFPSLKAIGWYMEAFGCAQVSANVTNFRLTPLHQIYEAARAVATEYGVQVQGSELIGLVPLEAILTAGHYYAKSFGLTSPDEAALIKAAVKGLGLDTLRPFSPDENIIEYKIASILT